MTSPEGKFLGTINLPIPSGEPKKQICSTNVAFGDNDARTLFISARDHVYKIRLKVPGILQGPGNQAPGGAIAPVLPGLCRGTTTLPR